jgi:hypothetical protein
VICVNKFTKYLTQETGWLQTVQSFPDFWKGENFFICLHILTTSGANPPSYVMNIEGPSPGASSTHTHIYTYKRKLSSKAKRGKKFTTYDEWKKLELVNL